MVLPSWVGPFSFWYVVGYQGLTLVYLWYRYLLLFYVEVRAPNEQATAYAAECFSIIVPFYNEKPELLRRTLQALREANGNKEVIVVDDGSTNRAAYEMAVEEFPDMLVLRYEDNRGKRKAQREGFLHATGEYVVTIDSDTVLDRNAAVNLLDPLLRDPRVGGTTGDVKVLNRYENFLTRMIAARYWNAFSIERKALKEYNAFLKDLAGAYIAEADAASEKGASVMVCALPMEALNLIDPDDPPRDDAEEQEAEGSLEQDFHDLLKARAMKIQRIKPIQLVLPTTYSENVKRRQRKKKDKDRKLQDPATRAWNFHTALYYKAGGAPWRLIRDEAGLD